MKAGTRLAKRSDALKLANGLGARLRDYRENASMSVREFARRTEVSPSLVSQIEHGRVTPSVDTLYRFANELGLTVDKFFSDGEPAPAVSPSDGALPASDRFVQRWQTRKKIQLAGGVNWERLTPTADDEVEFLHVIYQVGSESCCKDSLIRHGGKEYAYVLSGRLGVNIGFEEKELGPGDSMAFDSHLPHRVFTIGNEPATAIWVVLNRAGDARNVGA
jgi:transcriptional regulator with XRE-family HTH domain